MPSWRDIFVGGGGRARAELESRQSDRVEPPRTRVLAAPTGTAPLASIATGNGSGRSSGRGHADARRWQATAWAHRGRIGPIRGGLSWQADTIGGVRFGLAVHVKGEDQPVPADSPEARRVVSPRLLADAQTQLDRLPLHDSRFKTLIAHNVLTAGEVHLHGYPSPTRRRFEQWETLSMFQIRPRPGDETQIRDPETGDWRYVRDDEALIRLHSPDPAFPWLPDAPLRSLEDECQQIIMAMLELRSLSLSRIASNGWLLVPDTLSLLRATADEAGAATDISVTDDEFMAEFAAVALAPIMNPGAPGAAIPAVMRGDPTDLKEVRHVTIERSDAPKVLERYREFLHIVFDSLDLPVEQLEGIGSMKYWNGLVVTADRYRSYVEPKARLIGDILAARFVRDPLVSELRHDPKQTELLRVVPYGEHLLVNPNRVEDATKLHDRGAIGFAALRDAASFSDADAPTDDELALLLAIKSNGQRGNAAVIIGEPGDTPPATPRGPQPGDMPQAPDAVVPSDEEPPSAPAQQSSRRAAFAAAGADVDESSTRLSDIDRELRGRLVVAADAAVTRAIEQAAARLRSHVRTDPELRARLVGVPVTEVGFRVGRDRCRALGIDVQTLLAAAWDRLRTQFTEWVHAALADAGRVLSRLLGVDRDTVVDRITVSIRPRIELAWAPLADELERIADAALFDPATPTGVGEPHYGRVPPGAVREALATAGGWADPALGGIAVSQPAVDLFIASGWAVTGYMWRYGATMFGRWFEPHLDRDGVVFASRTADELRAEPRYASLVGAFYHPGDHPGCDCDWVTLWRPSERSTREAGR